LGGRFGVALFDLLYSLILRQGGEDRIWWISSKRRKFEVRPFFHKFSSSGCSSFPWNSIWRVYFPLGVSRFVWMAALGQILTLDNLRKRKVIVVEWCCMCKRSGESINHFLLHCEVARELWNAIFSLFGVECVMPRRVIELLDCFF